MHLDAGSIYRRYTLPIGRRIKRTGKKRKEKKRRFAGEPWGGRYMNLRHPLSWAPVEPAWAAARGGLADVGFCRDR